MATTLSAFRHIPITTFIGSTIHHLDGRINATSGDGFSSRVGLRVRARKRRKKRCPRTGGDSTLSPRSEFLFSLLSVIH
jgi:hypothetical protein